MEKTTGGGGSEETGGGGGSEEAGESRGGVEEEAGGRGEDCHYSKGCGQHLLVACGEGADETVGDDEEGGVVGEI